jgi:hypothetical protein
MSWIKDLFRHILRATGPKKESELWSIVLENRHYFHDGLCGLISACYSTRRISYDEKWTLFASMDQDKVKLPISIRTVYWIGPAWEWAPREEYILKKIKQLRSEGK